MCTVPLEDVFNTAMDPLWMAMSKLRRGKIDEAIALCDQMLSQNPKDQAAWLVKCKAVIKQNYIDDIELDEEGVAEMLMDENAVASMPRLVEFTTSIIPVTQ